MNILLINHYAGAPGLGRELRPYYLARHWQQAGHKVTIAAADHSHLRHIDPVAGKQPELRSINGVDYLFFATPRYNDTIAGRGRNISAFVLALWKRAESLAQEFAPDVVIAQSGYPYDYFAARRIASFAGARVVLEVRDLWPLHLQEHYHYRGGHPAVRFAQHTLGRAVTGADLVVPVLPQGQRYLAGFGLREEKCCAIPAGIAAPKGGSLPAGRAEKLRGFKQNGLLVMYCGNIGADHDLSAFVQSAGLLDQNYRLVLVGNGGNKITLKRSARQQGLENVLFLDGVQPAQVHAMLQMADLLYYPVGPRQQNSYGLASSKLLGYMLAGRPIIFDGSAAQNPVEACGCGVVLGGGDPQQIAGAIRQLGGMEEPQRQQMGQRGQQYVLQHHEYSLLAARYLERLQQLAEGKGSTKIS